MAQHHKEGILSQTYASVRDGPKEDANLQGNASPRSTLTNLTLAKGVTNSLVR